MRKIWLIPVFAVLLLTALSLRFTNTSQQAATENSAVNEKLAVIELKTADSGFARTSNHLWQTTDFGQSWREITPEKSAQQTINAVSFNAGQTGAAVLVNSENSSLELARTNTGGNSWTKQSVNLPSEILADADLNRISIEFADEQTGWLVVRLTSSSNFTRAALFATTDGGASWRLEQKFMESGEIPLETLFGSAFSEKQNAVATINGKDYGFLTEAIENIRFEAPLATDENVTAIDFSGQQNGWILAEAGRCRGFKSDCEQQARLLVTADGGASWQDRTPEAAKNAVKISDVSRNNAAPPGGSTRISFNRGFDKCFAATLAQMEAWWNNSPFYDSNIYIGGLNHNGSCRNSQPYLNQDWVNQVSNMGWGLILTWVGPQAPCSGSTNSSKHSSDPAIAETEGRAQADLAITAANNLGFAQGTVIYFDMERYDDVSGTGACSTPVKAFLKGWTDRMKERGYISGVYGSPTNAMGDWINIPAPSRMDAVWLARYDNVPSVWQYNSPSPVVPVTFWGNHQRIKQYQGGHNETWGGVTMNIDSDISDGPVAGVRPAKNKPADFDGDGKTDISVFRPDSGSWFVLNSSNNSFNAVGFGSATDILTPGDFDGDGKTDYAVFRSADGAWYELSSNPARPNAAVFRSKQFGTNGDIPVPADYDGDNRTDVAVFRAGAWYMTYSLDPRDPTFRGEQFGSAGDLPVPGDYDADGRDDLAVFRPSNGTWYMLRSTQGFYGVQFGANGDRPVQGDYDGDGKTDVAVYRPSNGVWYILKSSGGFSSAQFGIATDKPTPGDFDGDGKWDIAVFRPENGFWYALRSQAGFTAVNFGASGDRPVPSAYAPQN